MKYAPALPADFDTWQTGIERGFAAARRDVAGAVRAALVAAPTLYEWAAAQPGRDVFHGRGEAYGVTLGPVRAVVRHARRGGAIRLLSRDLFLGRAVRFLDEIRISRKLIAAGITTPAVLAGVAYPAPFSHRADVATERLDGVDLAALLFGAQPPTGAARAELFAAVGKAVRKLHLAGFVHPDLQLKNVLMLEETGGRAVGRSAVAFLDVDTCRTRSPRDEAAHHRNIKRFLRSWNKWNAKGEARLTAEDRRAFLAAYDPKLAR